ncbi:MAG: biotin--[acetyl-CoA-carboxylase] ligase [Verrucomicrobiota bacterium]
MSDADSGDRLDAAQIRDSLGQVRLGHEIIVVEEATSTNDLAWEAAGHGASEGFVIIAERQTAGRGQYGRRWESAPRQGLWFSVLLRPILSIAESPKLTDMLAAVVATAIKQQTGCQASIKQPNDIYIAGRKVAGVLVEGRTDRDGNYIAVAGIGVNVNQALEDFPEALCATAGSLAMATGRQISRGEFAVALLATLDSQYAAAGSISRSHSR